MLDGDSTASVGAWYTSQLFHGHLNLFGGDQHSKQQQPKAQILKIIVQFFQLFLLIQYFN
jgi:hypothetical protein